MKKIIMMCIAFGSLVNTAVALEDKEFKFSIGCKVTDQIVLASEDGVAKRYGRVKDGLDTGDSFRINFDFRKLGYWLVLRIDATSLGSLGMMEESFDSVTGKPFGPGFYAFETDFGRDVGTLHPDYLSVESITDSFSMTRYYKNDWELMAGNGNSPGGARLLTANCQSMPTQFDDVYKFFHKQLQKKEIK